MNATRYCADHQTENSAAAYKRLYDISRQNDPVRLLYRTKRWKATRAKVLRRDILCQVEDGCPQAATVADHWPLSAREIVAAFGKHEFYNPNMCRGLCKFHHDQSTAYREGFAKKPVPPAE